MSVTDASLNALSDEGRILWTAALDLARAAGTVSPEPRLKLLPPLLFFTDPVRTPEPWNTAARLPGGAAVVYRHFGAADAKETAKRLREATWKAGVSLLVGLDADLAAYVEADGVHLPERARAEAVALRQDRPGWLITGAAHLDAGPTWPTADLDALIASPVFTTASASIKRRRLGPEGLARVARLHGLPTYALGGVNASNVIRLMGTGACGIAGVEAFSRAFGD